MSALAEAVRVENARITVEEAVRLGADDPMFYSQYFFPKAVRQDPAPFHLQMWEDLLSTAWRHLSFMIARGHAKTTIARLFLSYVIAYGIARTILVVGKSQDAAVRTVEWLQRAVEFNRPWASAFDLRKGNKWTGTEVEIWHGAEEVPIRVIALGVTGSVRGVNVDDYRPDLILVDDPCDEENTATEDQRKKMSDLFFGALEKSLAPASEAPMAKMVLMQTVLNKEDLISKTVTDKQWKSLVFSCFDSNGQSRWPARWTTNELMAEKQAHIDRGDLSLWLREMECKIVDDTTAAFPSNFLQYWSVLPEGGRTILAIDPTPPPKNLEDIQKANATLDDACIMALREYQGGYYVCEVYVTKSPDPDEFVSEVFRMCHSWGVREIVIETTLFARTTKTLIEKEMMRRRQWLTIYPMEDKRAKTLRIRQAIKPIYTMRKLWVHNTQGPLIEQLTSYPAVNHDDMVDALSMGLEYLSKWSLGDGDYLEGDFAPVPDEPVVEETWQACP